MSGKDPACGYGGARRRHRCGDTQCQLPGLVPDSDLSGRRAKIDTGVALDLWSNCGQRCAVTILRGRLERRTLEFRPLNVHVYFPTSDLGVSFYILPPEFCFRNPACDGDPSKGSQRQLMNKKRHWAHAQSHLKQDAIPSLTQLFVMGEPVSLVPPIRCHDASRIDVLGNPNKLAGRLKTHLGNGDS